MSGFVVIVGFGSGNDVLVMLEVIDVFVKVIDIVGYIFYVVCVVEWSGFILYLLDNWVEIDWFWYVLEMVFVGKYVVVVFLGDSGVFVMVVVVLEVVEYGEFVWCDIDI